MPAAQQTPSMRREEAFAGDDRWVGLVRTEPGEWSGWHHHGDHETYFYVLAGELEFEYGSGAPSATVGVGGFIHMPGQFIHRERTKPPDAGALILVRMGKGPTVFNVDGPLG